MRGRTTLAGMVIRALLDRYPQAKDAVEDVILGCAMPEAESGNNMARVAALRAGLPDTVTGMTINRFCSSGLQAIAMAAERIRAGGADMLIAGGSESMSLIPRGGHKPAPNPWFVDHWPEIYLNMGLTAERMQREVRHFARGLRRVRAAQPPERYRGAAGGQVRRRDRARRGGVRHGGRVQRKVEKVTFARDEGPRADTSARGARQAQARVPCERHGDRRQLVADQRRGGGGAGDVASERRAQLGLEPKARFVSFAAGGVPPEIMGIGPVVAIPKALKLAGLKLDDIGVIELNEAFAVQALAVIQEAGLDLDRVNVNGGAIALGHPLGCTGAKLTATILREMERRGARYGMVTMCVGGGQGAAGIFEKI